MFVVSPQCSELITNGDAIVSSDYYCDFITQSKTFHKPFPTSALLVKQDVYGFSKVVWVEMTPSESQLFTLEDSMNCGMTLFHEHQTLQFYTEHYATKYIMAPLGGFYQNARRYLLDDGFLVKAEVVPEKQQELEQFLQEMKDAVNPITLLKGVDSVVFDFYFVGHDYDGYLSVSQSFAEHDFEAPEMRYKCED